MITPSKTISFKNPIIFKMTFILDFPFDEISLVSLYDNTKQKFTGLDEFIYALDALYALDKIDINIELGKIIKC